MKRLWSLFRGDESKRAETPAAAMVREQIRKRGVRDERVLCALESIDRGMFVTHANADHAFHDSALPIGHNQTISQPYIVALMTELLELRPEHRVLEIGTGSGYQTAVLALLAKEVVTIERVAELSRIARQRLSAMSFHNIRFLHGDGSRGVAAGAPYDRIIVTAAAEKIVDELLQQLSPDGGILVAPEGPHGAPGDPNVVQKLRRWFRQGAEFRVEDSINVRFVPLVDESAGAPPAP